MKDDTVWNDPEGAPILRRVAETFDAWNTARAKFNRCTKPATREAARKVADAAEVAYRAAAAERDTFVAAWKASRGL